MDKTMNTSQTGPVVDRLRSMAQTCIDGAEGLTAALLAFTYAAMQSGRLTLGEGCTNSTTKFEYDGVPTNLVAVQGDADAETAPLVTRSAGNVSLYRAICVNGVALYRCGTTAGGHDPATPEGATDMAATVLGVTSQKDHQKVAQKMRPLVKGDKAPTVTAVRKGAKKATTTVERGTGTGTVRNVTPETCHGMANRLVGHVATVDWEGGKDGLDHLAGTVAALEGMAADLSAILDGMTADAALLADAI
jgi:hypothetical protein